MNMTTFFWILLAAAILYGAGAMCTIIVNSRRGKHVDENELIDRADPEAVERIRIGKSRPQRAAFGLHIALLAMAVPFPFAYLVVRLENLYVDVQPWAFIIFWACVIILFLLPIFAVIVAIVDASWIYNTEKRRIERQLNKEGKLAGKVKSQWVLAWIAWLLYWIAGLAILIPNAIYAFQH
jgi:uncharacterized membrane protein YhaH (DUF805 family)